MVKYGKKARLLTMMAMTGLFFLAEIITGYLTNSMALVADSFHMLSDVLSILIGFLAVHYSGKKSKTNTYDWARAEVLGAMANAVFLMALVFTIIIAAVQRLINVERITQPLLVLAVGVAGLVINVIGLAIFGSHAHGHSHDHGDHAHGNSSKDHPDNDADDDQTITTSQRSIEEASTDKSDRKKKGHSGSHINMQAVFLHVLGDALGSIVVIISALVIHFVQDDWRFYVDPVMSLVTSVIISFTTIPLLRRASMILLQNPPHGINVDAVRKRVAQVPGVINIHDLHVWQLSGNCVIATAHVILDDGCDFTDVAKQLKKIFHEVDIHSTTIQPEYLGTKNNSRQLLLEGATGETDTLCKCRVRSRVSEGEIHVCDVKIVTSRYRNFQDEIRLSDGATSDDDSDSACLLSCLSDDCLPRMCCDGVRRRCITTQSNQFENKGFAANENPTEESTSVEIGEQGDKL